MPSSQYDVLFDRGDGARGMYREVGRGGDRISPIGYADGNGPGEPAWISGGYFDVVYGMYGGKSGAER